MDTTAGLEPQRTALDAGQEGTFVLSVRNDSEIVEDYALRVVGDLAEWATVEPAHVSVFPGHSATALVTVTPPRSSAVAAGEHPLGVHVRPVKRSENAAVPEGVVEVLPFFDTVAELSPQSTTSRRGGTYRVAVDNRGNAPAAVALAAKSASDGLGIALSETEQTMEPGTTWNSEIHTEPVKRLWRGTPVAYPFTVMVTPEEGPATALAGTQHQSAVLPAWTFRSLAGLLALSVGAVVLFFSPVGDRVCGALADPEPPGICRDRVAASTVRDEEKAEAEVESEAQPEDQSEAEPEAEPEVQPEDQPEAEPEAAPAPEAPPGDEPAPEAEPEAQPEAETEVDPLPAAAVPVFPEGFSLYAEPEQFSDMSNPWPAEQATGPFTITDLTVDVSADDTGTFNLVVFEPGGDIDLWLRRPLAEISPGASLVVEEAEGQQGIGGSGTGDLPEDPNLQSAVDQMTEHLTDGPEDAGPGTVDETDPVPLPTSPFTVEPEQKLLVFVHCETPGNQVQGVCYESVTLDGRAEEAETGE